MLKLIKGGKKDTSEKKIIKSDFSIDDRDFSVEELELDLAKLKSIHIDLKDVIDELERLVY